MLKLIISPELLTDENRVKQDDLANLKTAWDDDPFISNSLIVPSNLTFDDLRNALKDLK